MSEESKTGFETIDKRNDALLFSDVCTSINKLSDQRYRELRIMLVMRPHKHEWDELMSS